MCGKVDCRVWRTISTILAENFQACGHPHRYFGQILHVDVCSHLSPCRTGDFGREDDWHRAVFEMLSFPARLNVAGAGWIGLRVLLDDPLIARIQLQLGAMLLLPGEMTRGQKEPGFAEGFVTWNQKSRYFVEEDQE